MNRRQWLFGAGVGAVAGNGSHRHIAVHSFAAEATGVPKAKPLDISQYEPKSMLQVHESYVAQGQVPGHRYPYSHFRVGKVFERCGTGGASVSIWALQKNASA